MLQQVKWEQQWQDWAKATQPAFIAQEGLELKVSSFSSGALITRANWLSNVKCVVSGAL